jgi:hypothetical protein
MSQHHYPIVTIYIFLYQGIKAQRALILAFTLIIQNIQEVQTPMNYEYDLLQKVT